MYPPLVKIGDGFQQGLTRVNIPSWVSRLARLGTDLLFPPKCIGCMQVGAIFCARCAQQVMAIPTSVCSRCGRMQPQAVTLCSLCQQEAEPSLTLTRAAAIYDEPLRAAIHALKYEGRAELAEPLSRYLVAIFQLPPWSELPHTIDACVPVPLHAQRLAERGYNQSALLTTRFAQRMDLSVEENYLTRTRETVSQVTLSADERHTNVAGAFTATPEVAGKRLLVIDDVTTTGATLTACANALKMAGATQIYGMALAMPRYIGSDSVPMFAKSLLN